MASQTLIVHRDNLPLLEKAAAAKSAPNARRFSIPFDNLWWAQGRDEAFWGFRHRLEAYVPAPKRVYGYFCLPILHKDRLVGRFDPKLERKTGILRLKALYLEPGIEPDEELVADVAGAMRDFMQFHKATELVIEKSEPARVWGKAAQGAVRIRLSSDLGELNLCSRKPLYTDLTDFADGRGFFYFLRLYPCSSVNPCNPCTENEPSYNHLACELSHKSGENQK